jgi:hypothetical protein
MQFFRNESSDPKRNAQRNLSGRTHYVDDDTLRFHKSRVLQDAISDGGLLFALVESYAVDYQNTRRLYRPVVFDIFGTILTKCDLEDGYKSSKAAGKAMWEELNAIDAKAHTLAAIEKQKQNYLAECDDMAAKVRAL